jgi:hypothetical protein
MGNFNHLFICHLKYQYGFLLVRRIKAKNWQNCLLTINHFVSAGTKASHYDPNHRNPLYCNADNECIWELKQLVNHFHPTVSLFASKLVKVIWLHHTATVVKARIQMSIKNYYTSVIYSKVWIKIFFKKMLTKYWWKIKQ